MLKLHASIGISRAKAIWAATRNREIAQSFNRSVAQSRNGAGAMALPPADGPVTLRTTRELLGSDPMHIRQTG
jgi:hypothetical protein